MRITVIATRPLASHQPKRVAIAECDDGDMLINYFAHRRDDGAIRFARVNQHVLSLIRTFGSRVAPDAHDLYAYVGGENADKTRQGVFFDDAPSARLDYLFEMADQIVRATQNSYDHRRVYRVSIDADSAPDGRLSDVSIGLYFSDTSATGVGECHLIRDGVTPRALSLMRLLRKNLHHPATMYSA